MQRIAPPGGVIAGPLLGSRSRIPRSGGLGRVPRVRLELLREPAQDELAHVLRDELVALHREVAVVGVELKR